MKILVTGGAGFIGSHIVESLVEQGHDVVVYDNFSSGSPENLVAVKNQCRVITGDILDRSVLKQAMQGVDLVSHQAAQLEIFRSTDDPHFDLEVNTVGTLNILMAAKEAGVKKVMNASSACLYGQAQGATVETIPLRPNWAYGVSKLAAEAYGHVYTDAHNLPVTSLRYAIVYGEREWYRRVLTVFVRRAARGEPLVIFGDGLQVRDFIHVSDVVALHNRCLFDNRTNGQAYNCGTGVGTTVRQLAEAVTRCSATPLEIIHEDTQEGQYSKLVPEKRRNTAELGSMCLGIGKAEQELQWSPLVTLDVGLKRSLAWASANPHRWTGINYSQ